MCFDRNIIGNRDDKFFDWDYWSLHWPKKLTLLYNSLLKINNCKINFELAVPVTFFCILSSMWKFWLSGFEALWELLFQKHSFLLVLTLFYAKAWFIWLHKVQCMYISDQSRFPPFQIYSTTDYGRMMAGSQNSLRPISYLGYILVRPEKQSYLQKKQLNSQCRNGCW